jgi:exodeoxyribonuclease VII large subunit
VLAETLNEFRKKIASSLIGNMDRASRDISGFRERIAPGRMMRRIAERQQDIAVIAEQLSRALSNTITFQRLVLAGMEEKISGRNPLLLLERGYGIIEKDGRAQRSTAGICPGDVLSVRMKDGTLDVQVKRVIHGKNV